MRWTLDKGSTTKADNMGLILSTHMVEGEKQLLQFVL